MSFHLLEPEVAGGLGARTVMDTASHPPVVTHLHYEVEGWLGDDLLESTPCFLISPAAAEALRATGVGGFDVAPAEVTVADDVAHVVDPRVTTFGWLKPNGQAGVDDIGVAPDASLVVSDRALEVLRRFHLDHCDISDYAP